VQSRSYLQSLERVLLTGIFIALPYADPVAHDYALHTRDAAHGIPSGIGRLVVSSATDPDDPDISGGSLGYLHIVPASTSSLSIAGIPSLYNTAALLFGDSVVALYHNDGK